MESEKLESEALKQLGQAVSPMGLRNLAFGEEAAHKSGRATEDS
jgi:hypothetical protein